MKMNITTTIIPGILLNVAVFIFTIKSSGQVPDNIRATQAVTGNIVTRTGSQILNKGNLIVKGNWINNGTFTDTTGIVVFTDGEQTLGGTSSTPFNNLTITSTSSTTISTPGQTLREILLADGELNAAGNLTLLSTPARTALIDGSGQGEVFGNVTLQRYLPSAYGYHYFSSPFTAATVGEFSDEIDLSADFPTFYRYDENRMSSGWVSFTNTANILNPLEGYALNFGTAGTPLTADATGVVNNGNLQVTLYNHDSTYTKGFNLAGNPYPSPIDWDADAGWIKSGIDTAIYYFNASDTSQYTGSYSSYVNGISSDGIASNIIPSMQGFFVHVSDGTYPVTGTLACTNTARTTGLTPVFHKKNSQVVIPMIRLTANFTDAPGAGDPTVIYFYESATEGFDPALDALKLMNTDTLAPSLYGEPALSGKLSINAIPTLSNNSVAIPLGLRILRDGRISFKVEGIETLPSGMIVYLFDAMTGMHTDLEKKPEYLVNLDEGTHENRFWLKFSLDELPDEPGEGDPFFIYNSGGQLYINTYLGSGEKGKLAICNLAGQQLWDMEVAGNQGYVIDPEVPMGIYIAFLYSKQHVHAQKILISP